MAEPTTKAYDVEALRKKLAQSGGREYWRSLDELAETPEYTAFLEDEFPQQMRPLRMEVDRRHFLTLAGASLALAGLTGCRNLPADRIVPYTNQPEDVVLGKPLSYATAMSLGGVALGLLVTSREGRPIKIEGNPDHPASLGSTNALAQASVLDLYDPDRVQTVSLHGNPSSWVDVQKDLVERMKPITQNRGKGLAILTGSVNSPTLAGQMDALLADLPEAKWHHYEPINKDNAYGGAELAYGERLSTRYWFNKAKVVVSLDSDFLGDGVTSVRYARDFFAMRKPRKDQMAMNRLYVAESSLSLTGTTADHHLPVKPSQIESLAREIAAKLAVSGASSESSSGESGWVDAAVNDLKANAGASIVLCGDHQPPAVHALCHAINQALGNVDQTVTLIKATEFTSGSHAESLANLVKALEANEVSLLLILGGDPVYSAPADLNLAATLDGAASKVHLTTHENATSRKCDWVLPASHYLEHWSDASTFNGEVTICQPLIQPLYDTRSAHDILGLLHQKPMGGFERVQSFWKTKLNGGADFDEQWNLFVQRGVVFNTGSRPVLASLDPSAVQVKSGLTTAEYEVVVLADSAVFDGRFANNGWLLEAPRPLTKVVWDNCAWVSPATAERLKVGQGNLIEITVGEKTVRVPAYPLPGQADGVITVHLGYGQTGIGKLGDKVGVDVNPIRTLAEPNIITKATVKGLEAFQALVTTQTHHSMEGRDIVRLQSLQKVSTMEEAEHEAHPSIFPAKEHEYDGYKWGMSVDLTACIGCNACVIACQAENNIPIVGKEQVRRGREMHWIRVDRYNSGDVENPRVLFQPLMCQHCEAAPCEPVCPVAATVHSKEGLNQMVYNRCVGTRYCSNNCPYKVRRYNFFNYANHHDVNAFDQNARVLKLVNNPDVTVRGRGVMEKCTFCVQRINAARIEAKKEGRKIADGEIQTACQSACPTQAITFGDIGNHESKVAAEKHQPHNYEILNGELNTHPRTTYLSKVTNPNDALKGEFESALDEGKEEAHGA